VKVLALDHLVLTVRDLDATIAFYERIGMELSTPL
jgi:catechol 2,3-dioxygenase-like lactoylglutathione lyase family enzyme